MSKSKLSKPVRIQVSGKSYRFPNLKVAARHFKIPYVPFYARLRLGWSVRKALITPLRNTKPRKYIRHPDVTAHYARLAAGRQGSLH